jgi:hypothetical protein
MAAEKAEPGAVVCTSGSMRKRSTRRKEMSCSSNVLTARGKMFNCFTRTAKMERTRKPCSTWRGWSGAKTYLREEERMCGRVRGSEDVPGRRSGLVRKMERTRKPRKLEKIARPGGAGRARRRTWGEDNECEYV